MDITDIRSAAPALQLTAPATTAATASRQSAATPELPGVAVLPTTKTEDNSNVDSKELKSAVKDVRRFVDAFAAELEFSVDDDSGRTVVKVIDSSTKELIRQMPSKEMLEIAKALDNFKGLFIKQKV